MSASQCGGSSGSSVGDLPKDSEGRTRLARSKSEPNRSLAALPRPRPPSVHRPESVASRWRPVKSADGQTERHVEAAEWSVTRVVAGWWWRLAERSVAWRGVGRASPRPPAMPPSLDRASCRPQKDPLMASRTRGAPVTSPSPAHTFASPGAEGRPPRPLIPSPPSVLCRYVGHGSYLRYSLARSIVCRQY